MELYTYLDALSHNLSSHNFRSIKRLDNSSGTEYKGKRKLDVAVLTESPFKIRYFLKAFIYFSNCIQWK